ncbi:TetR/AcrR family transcriptional regulator [bacterium]|nr:TetR/AcrR family transcriptional regulator [bacterium]
MKDKKLSRREREKLIHRRQILNGALDLFSEKGYHNASMHEIAAKTEFAIGTIYKFFTNKEELYKALMMDKATEYHNILSKVLSRGGDVLTIINDYILAKSEIFAADIATLRLYFAETRGASFNIKAGLDKDIHKVYDKLIEQLVFVFERGINEKLLQKMDSYYMAIALEGITNAFLFCWLEDPQQHSYEKNVPMIRDMFLKGVLAG